jgi:hypothetical protein
MSRLERGFSSTVAGATVAVRDSVVNSAAFRDLCIVRSSHCALRFSANPWMLLHWYCPMFPDKDFRFVTATIRPATVSQSPH